MMEVLPKDPRSHEPWWNEGCEDLYRQECEARLQFEKNPSLEASKAFRRLQRQFRKAVAAAERNYAYQMQMAPGNYRPDFPHAEGSWKKQELKKPKEKKKKKKSNKDDGTESDADNLDLNQEMFPLSHYVSDQEELISQMFSIIKGPKLEAMLPPILRSIPLHELKNLCLHELRGMSKKRILCAISGQEMEGSSESEEEEEQKENVGATNSNNEESPSKKSVPDTGKNLDNTTNNKGIPAFLLKTIKVEDQDDNSSGAKSSSGGKSVLELLELQMRARIIKTMLEKGDDGKTLTEDAIVALMGTPTQSSDVAKSIVTVKTEKDDEVVGDPNGKEHSKGGKEADKKKSSEEKRHRDGRSGHRKEHHSRKGTKRQRSIEIKDSDEENEKRTRKGRSSDKRHKKKKITRKEFEERMKRAKKNRSYRQRKSSGEEEKLNATKKSESGKDEKVDDGNKDKSEDAPNDDKKDEDGKTVPEKEEGAVSEREEGEAVSEKEEGELDSDEEEDGACSPSDISSASYYSSSRSYTSRSRSRSYSRSLSRSPVRRRGRGRSRSRSRSWTRSRSRSRSTDRRKRDGGRSSRRSRKDNHSSGGLKKSSGIVSLPSNSNNKQQQKEEEDNWGQTCDIELVDSEEDFDDNSGDPAKISAANSKKPLPMKGSSFERASISFSLQKKTVPSITPNVDLDDLPLKSSSLGIGKGKKISETEIVPRKESKEPEEIINLDSPKMPSDQILISSDSDQEGNNVVKTTKSVRVEKRDQIHGVKMAKVSTKQAVMSGGSSAPINKSNADRTDGNQFSKVSSQEQDLQGSKNANDKLSIQDKCSSADQSLGTKVDAENLQKTNEDNAENIQSNTSESRVDNEKESFINKEKMAVEEKQDENIGVQSVDASEDVREEEKDLTRSSCVSSEDQDSPVASTVCTTEENRITSCPRDSDEIKETLLPENDGHLNVMPKRLQGLEVKVDNVGKEKVELGTTNETLEKDDVQPCVISNESALTSKLASVKEYPETRALRERKIADENAVQKHHESRTQKVILEHLQDSYDEEQDNNPESGSEDQKPPPCQLYEENVTTDYIETKSPIEKISHEEPSDEAIEVSEKSPIEEDKSREEIEKGEDLKEYESTEPILKTDDDKEDKRTDHKSNDDSNKPSEDDFFRGANELTFSDDDTEGCKNEDLEDMNENREVEPIRINTGLISRRVTRSKKIEMEAPGKSWTKKEKKKKEKPKDVLAMEGIGLLRKTLAESVQSPSPKEEEKESSMIQKETNEPTNDDDTCTSWGVSSISSKEETSVDSRVQSPKENTAQTSDASPSENSENVAVPDTDPDQTKNNQDTEIIGVIEASSDANKMDDIDIGGSSWSMRWLQSEKVQKVVSSSKMLSRVRKKIQKKDKATKVVTTSDPDIPVKKIPDPVVSVIGSIEEYERLFGMKVKKSSEETAEVGEGSAQAASSSEKVPDEPSKDTNQQPAKKATFGSDDEGEDSEEEALWSKILGK